MDTLNNDNIQPTLRKRLFLYLPFFLLTAFVRDSGFEIRTALELIWAKKTEARIKAPDRHIDERIADAEDELVKLHCEKQGKEVYVTVTVSEELQ